MGKKTKVRIGVAVFSTTKQHREPIDGKVTEWLRSNPNLVITDTWVTQSSDSSHHCITITFMWEERL